MNIVEAVEFSLRLKEQRCSLKRTLSQVLSNVSNEADSLYVKACILYNFQKYPECLDALFRLNTTNNYRDYQLFSMASRMYFASSKYKSSITDNVFNLIEAHKQDFAMHQLATIKDGLQVFKNSKDSRDSKWIDSINKMFFEDIEDIKSSINFHRLENKNIINVYYDASNSGLGDFLRGSCYLYQLLSDNNINFQIDMSKHGIGKYFESTCTEDYGKIFDTEKYHKEICVTSDYIFNMKQNLVRKLNSTKARNVPIFCNYSDFINMQTTDKQVYELSNKCQNFMRKNLNPKPEIKNYFKRLKRKFRIKDFNVIHFRLGDAEIFKEKCKDLDNNNINTHSFNISYRHCLDQILKTYLCGNKKTTIILADSNTLKEYIMQNMPEIYKDEILCLHNKSEHCSDNPGFIKDRNVNKKEKSDNMFYVALDLHILSKASKIDSFSVYEWGSGFCFWTAKIFDIPIYNHFFSQDK